MLRCPHCLEEIKVSVALGARRRSGAPCVHAPWIPASRKTHLRIMASMRRLQFPASRQKSRSTCAGSKRRRGRKAGVNPITGRVLKSNLIAALVLIGGAGLSLAVSAANAAHLLDFFINGMLPAFLCLMCAALCLFFWSH